MELCGVMKLQKFRRKVLLEDFQSLGACVPDIVQKQCSLL
jgi:hypothetical protein